jgi:hypothetical protein
MEALIAFGAALGSEALKTWGAFAICLMLLGAAIYWLAKSNGAKDARIKTLETRIETLQDLRLQDAREMIRVTETGTATMAARAEGDARFRDLMSQLVNRIEDIRPMRLPPPASP